MASGVYLTATRIPAAGTATQSVVFGPITSTTSSFSLQGGDVALTAIGTFTTAVLQALAGDATTWATVATFSAAGWQQVKIGQGQYRWAIT
jgi:hypothetical protein